MVDDLEQKLAEQRLQYYVRDSNIALRRALSQLPKADCVVLEAGCGSGRFIRALRRHRPGLRGYGCDLDVSAIRGAVSWRDGIEYCLGSLNNLPYAESSFDVILLFDVLEHLSDPAEGITEVSRVLKSGGILHALVPCEGQPLTLHWLMKKWNIIADLKQRHGHHLQRFTHRSLVNLLQGHGFNIEKMTYSMHPLGQVRDILTYLRLEEWAKRWRLDNPLYRFLLFVLWPKAYIESSLLSRVALSAVAVHITARKV